jgi:hypothetical protein
MFWPLVWKSGVIYALPIVPITDIPGITGESRLTDEYISLFVNQNDLNYTKTSSGFQ